MNRTTLPARRRPPTIEAGARRLLFAPLLAGLAGCGFFSGAEPPDLPAPDLAGDWVLNRDASSDSVALAALAADTVRQRFAFVGPRTPNGGAGPAVWDTVPPGQLPRRFDARELESFAKRIAPVERFTIATKAAPNRVNRAAANAMLTFHAPDVRPIEVPTDGTDVTATWLDGRRTRIRARWANGRLEIERRSDDLRVTEYYSRSPGSDRLVVYAIIDGPMSREVRVRRVYSPATSRSNSASIRSTS